MSGRKFLFASIALLLPSVGHAQQAASDLYDSTMEQLTQVQINVNSVSRKDENIWQTAAAVYVITRADIGASAAANIPDLLRGVPGLQVAQISASSWAVSARGFNSAFANKLLVLVDGRTVYSEIYSGTHWDEIDMPLTNVERIEIIRGPGAAVWGTNAVNGVINIITRSARTVSAPGAVVRFSRTEDYAFVQDGGTLGDNTQYRAFLSYINRKALDLPTGGQAFDGQSLFRLGGRIDWQPVVKQHLSFFGDAYFGHSRQSVTDRVILPIEPLGHEHDSIAGGFLLARWEHTGHHSNSELQAYAVVAKRDELAGTSRTITSDYDYVNHLAATKRIDLVWGGELRLTNDVTDAPVRVFLKRSYNNYLLDGFLQSQITLVPNRLKLTLGSKMQEGTLAGFQVQPSVRLGWSATPGQFFWGAISRAVVAPALQEKQIELGISLGTENGLPVIGGLLGDPAFKPEELSAFEGGARRRIGSTLTVDLAGFYHLTQRIQSVAVGTPTFIMGPSPNINVPLIYGNGYSARSEGVETTVHWKPRSGLDLEANHTWIEGSAVQKQPGLLAEVDSFATAKNTYVGQAHWTVKTGTVLTTSVFRVGAIASPASVGSSASLVPAYTRLDARLSRRFGSHASLDLGGTSLLQPRHAEFAGATTFSVPLVVPRSVFVRAGWSF